MLQGPRQTMPDSRVVEQFGALGMSTVVANPYVDLPRATRDYIRAQQSNEQLSIEHRAVLHLYTHHRALFLRNLISDLEQRPAAPHLRGIWDAAQQTSNYAHDYDKPRQDINAEQALRDKILSTKEELRQRLGEWNANTKQFKNDVEKVSAFVEKLNPLVMEVIVFGILFKSLFRDKPLP